MVRGWSPAADPATAGSGSCRSTTARSTTGARSRAARRLRSPTACSPSTPIRAPGASIPGDASTPTAMTAPPLHLLLADADDHRPALADGLAGDALDRTAAPAGLPEARELRDRGRDPSDLAAQRWALIVPEGEAGARLKA